jgi:tRNA1(Val) A37 N6-methylase TrmN6
MRLVSAKLPSPDGRGSVMPETTPGHLLGGRVVFVQPAAGYRAAIDPILLAAAVPDGFTGRALDLGCGAGAATLCLAARASVCSVSGLERDPVLAQLAWNNARANGFGDRMTVTVGDVRDPPLPADSFDEVIANPPYLDAARADAVAHAGKAAATVEGEAILGDWVAGALRLVRRKGAVTIIHRADRLDALLGHLGRGAGEIVIVPLWPRQGASAKRVIVRARKGVGSPLRLTAGLVLHEADGTYTAAASRILRDGQGLWHAAGLDRADARAADA